MNYYRGTLEMAVPARHRPPEVDSGEEGRFPPGTAGLEVSPSLRPIGAYALSES